MYRYLMEQKMLEYVYLCGQQNRHICLIRSIQMEISIHLAKCISID